MISNFVFVDAYDELSSERSPEMNSANGRRACQEGQMSVIDESGRSAKR